MTPIEKLEARYEPEPNSGCWLWIGKTSELGYGLFHLGMGKYRAAHRVAYELLVGPIPDGLDIDHLCRVRCCVNPAHLEPVTHLENCLRGTAGSKQKARTHCPQGHEYTTENTKRVWKADGSVKQRACRICENARWRRIYHRRKAEGINRNEYYAAKRRAAKWRAT